jgi:hypothetical protein
MSFRSAGDEGINAGKTSRLAHLAKGERSRRPIPGQTVEAFRNMQMRVNNHDETPNGMKDSCS